ncbi:MAG: type II toxin-antitoxin system Phd/YefM family antitoxin [Thermoanaerobaculia bacterium]|nr:type II toxin-antitoxin system Phd/YefM family antitoxin [Thermoanaerobaculia bacterium]
MIWKVAEAKQNLSKLLRAAATKPQKIYRRNHLVAAVVDSDTFAEFESWQREQERRKAPSEVFAELRRLCAEEQFEFPEIPRIDRENSFIEEIDDE